jgi:hypothetical protein
LARRAAKLSGDWEPDGRVARWLNVTSSIATSQRPPDAAEAENPDALLAALTTEHFTLQGARSQTVSESSSRAALYIGSVSSALVALGFIAQASDDGDVFDVFALTVLPTLYLLGLSTFVRLIESSAEDFRYGLAINRIRGYYQRLAGDRADLFLLSGHDDAEGVLANMGVPRGARQQYFTFASAVAVINSVIAGAAIAIAVSAFANAAVALCAAAGGAAAAISVVASLRFGAHLLAGRARETEALFPSPPD